MRMPCIPRTEDSSRLGNNLSHPMDGTHFEFGYRGAGSMALPNTGYWNAIRSRPHFVIAEFFLPRSLAPSLRFLAAAIDAFLARSERSSGVMVSRLRFPPIFPPLRPISAMTWDIRLFLSIASS